MLTNSEVCEFLRMVANKLETDELSTTQKAMTYQFYLKYNMFLSENPLISKDELKNDIWDYLSLGILLLTNSQQSSETEVETS